MYVLSGIWCGLNDEANFDEKTIILHLMTVWC